MSTTTTSKPSSSSTSSSTSSSCIEMDKSQLKSLLKGGENNGGRMQSDHIGLKLTKFLCSPDQTKNALYCAAHLCDKKDDGGSSTSSDPSTANSKTPLTNGTCKYAQDKSKVV